MPEHVENINKISLLYDQGFEGPDNSLAISLFEYGIAWRNLGEETLFIYGITHDGHEYTDFDRCTYRNDTDPFQTWNWVDWVEVSEQFFDGQNCFDTLSFAEQVNILYDIHGYEKIFGSSYWEGFKIQNDD